MNWQLLTIGLLITSIAHGEIYEYTSDTGRVVYSERVPYLSPTLVTPLNHQPINRLPATNNQAAGSSPPNGNNNCNKAMTGPTH